MRIRVAGATVVSRAVVLSALALPMAAQAAERTGAAARPTSFAAKAVRPRDSSGNTKFSHAVINGGKDIVLGTTGTKSVTVTYIATNAGGVALTEAFLWQGTDSSTTDGITGGLGTDDDPACTETATQGTYTCKAVFTIHPATDMKGNGVAATWKLFLGAWDLYASASSNDDVATAAIKKASTLTANATPEPAKKGKTITVTGRYAGYVSQPAKRQFRKKGSSTYTTLKTVKTNSTGALKTTAAATAPGDFADVR
ncbi:hypothetical protein [Streptomyces prunicolor]